MNQIRWVLAALLMGLAVGGFAQDRSKNASDESAGPTKLPDYFGFYVLNIPDFGWTEGAKISGQFERWRGTLDLTHPARPLFQTKGRDPIPLAFSQASALMLSVTDKTVFDLVGVEGTSQRAHEDAKSFFVPFYAEVNGQTISLVPTIRHESRTPGERPSDRAAPPHP